MNRTIPVLAALACAAASVPAVLPTSASASFDRRRHDPVAEARAAVEAAGCALRDALAERDALARDLADARDALADADRGRRFDALARDLDLARDRCADAEREVAGHESDLRRLVAERDRYKAAFLDECRRDRDYRDAAGRLATAKLDLARAEADALEAARCTYDWRRLRAEADDSAEVAARVDRRRRAPARFVGQSRRDLAEAEARLAAFEREWVAGDSCVRAAVEVVRHEERGLADVLARLSRGLDRDPDYRRACDAATACERDLADARDRLDDHREIVARLDARLGGGGRFVRHVDHAGLERRVDALCRNLEVADDRVACAEADLLAARRDYDRAARPSRGSCYGDDRGDRSRRRR